MVQTKKRFYILPVLFLILIYLDGIFILYFNENWRLVLMMVAASAMIGIVNCIFAFTCCRKGKERFWSVPGQSVHLQTHTESLRG